MSEPIIFGRLLPLPDREPSIEAASANPASANIQAMQAEAQFDCGFLSSRELARIELRLSGLLRTRHLFNPFTGEYRREMIRPMGWGGWE